MIIDTTQTKIERNIAHRKAFPIREDCTVLRPVSEKIRIGWIETPLEECTWVRWENCPAHAKDCIDGWRGLWMAIPTRELAAGESE